MRTPGKWRVQDNPSDKHVQIVDERGEVIATLYPVYYDDARLIARAPDLEEEVTRLRERNRELVETIGKLIEECNRLNDDCAFTIKTQNLIDKAQAVLAKEGGSKRRLCPTCGYEMSELEKDWVCLKFGCGTTMSKTKEAP